MTAVRAKSGGRKPGSINKKTAERIARIEASGITPLDYMLLVMRTPPPKRCTTAQRAAHVDRQFEAAKAAAPYVHAKLAQVQHSGTGAGGALLVQLLGSDASL